MPLPADEIHLHDPAHVAWLREQVDPELWHVAATSALTFGDPHGFAAWVVEQDEVDRATAGYLFLGRYGPEWLSGRPVLGGEGLSGDDLVAVFEAVCRRSATRGFTRDELGLDPGFETPRRECLAVVDEGRMAPGMVAPTALVATPFPQPRPLGYQVEDGAIFEA